MELMGNRIVVIESLQAAILSWCSGHKYDMAITKRWGRWTCCQKYSSLD